LPARGIDIEGRTLRVTPALANLDPPGHARHRRVANAAFSPKRITSLGIFTSAFVIQELSCSNLH
jgi:cytochrome P450